MKYVKKLILTTLILIVFSTALAGMSVSIDEVRVLKSDIFGTATPVVMTLRIIGDSESSPYKWTVSFKKSSDTVFSTTHDDKWLDKFFSDEGYVEGCKGYAECKHKWYFNDLPFLLQNALREVKRGDRPVEKWEIDSLRLFADGFLIKKGLDQAKRSAVITEMLDLLSSKYVSFCPPYTPVQPDTCFMYVPSLGYFVPYWDD